MEHLFPDAESRLILLYALDRLGTCSDQQLLIFLSDLSLMNYFSLHLNLTELLHQGYITQKNHPFGVLCQLTEQGRYILREFQPLLSDTTTDMMEEACPAYRVRFEAEQHAPAGESPLPDGGVGVRLQLLEQERLILDIQLAAEKHFSCLDRRWQQCCDAVYAFLYEILGDGFNPRTQSMTIPDSVTMTNTTREASRQEWTLYMADTHLNPSFTLILVLEDPLLAAHFAQAWPQTHADLRLGILAMLDSVSV